MDVRTKPISQPKKLQPRTRRNPPHAVHSLPNAPLSLIEIHDFSHPLGVMNVPSRSLPPVHDAARPGRLPFPGELKKVPSVPLKQAWATSLSKLGLLSRAKQGAVPNTLACGSAVPQDASTKHYTSFFSDASLLDSASSNPCFEYPVSPTSFEQSESSDSSASHVASPVSSDDETVCSISRASSEVTLVHSSDLTSTLAPIGSNIQKRWRSSLTIRGRGLGLATKFKDMLLRRTHHATTDDVAEIPIFDIKAKCKEPPLVVVTSPTTHTVAVSGSEDGMIEASVEEVECGTSDEHEVWKRLSGYRRCSRFLEDLDSEENPRLAEPEHYLDVQDGSG